MNPSGKQLPVQKDFVKQRVAALEKLTQEAAKTAKEAPPVKNGVRLCAPPKVKESQPRPVLKLDRKAIGVKGENAKLTLSADNPFSNGRLTVKGADCIRLRQGNSQVTKFDFNRTTDLEVEAVKGSAMNGVEFEWEVQGEKVSAKLTVVQGTLKIYDKSGKEIEFDEVIGSKPRVIHKGKSRAKVEVSCQPKEWAGQLELESVGQKIKLFTNSSGPDGEAKKVQVAASATPAPFYVGGLETSGSVWDTDLKLHLVGLGEKEVDEAKITVIETALEVSQPRDATAPVNPPDARVKDFGTAPGSLSAPQAEQSGQVTLYKQGSQFRSPRALVRIKLAPEKAPCKLILKPVKGADKIKLLPEACERHRQNEAAHPKNELTIEAGGIEAAQEARRRAGNSDRYGAAGYVLWAEGVETKGTFGSTPQIRLDVDGVDDDCGRVEFDVKSPELRVEVKRSDGNALTGGVNVEGNDVATADVASVKPEFTGTILPPSNFLPVQDFKDFDAQIANYRIKVTPQNKEKDFRVTLTEPKELPVAVTGPCVDAKFVLDPPYQQIQFIGYRLKTGGYKGLDKPSALNVQQEGEAETQAKVFTMASVLSAVDKLSDETVQGNLKAALLKATTFDNVMQSKEKDDIEKYTGIDLKKAYTKELEGVKNDIARREAANTDIEKRCAVMIEAVQEALIRSDKNSIVLKVFMAPEFYFRGQQGAYPEESLHQILPILSTETRKPAYKDWLFIFGSALGYLKKPEEPYFEVPAATAKTADGTFTFDHNHPTLVIQPGWVLKLAGSRLPIVGCNRKDIRNWNLTVTLKPQTTLSRDSGAVTEGHLAFDHHGNFDIGSISKSVREVHLTIDFPTNLKQYPMEGWKFEQGTTKGIVSAATQKQGTEYDVVLRMNVARTLDPAKPIKFTTSSQAVEIFNVCFVQKGGEGTPVGSDGIALKELMVEKEAISKVDFTGPDYGSDKFRDPLHHLIDLYDSQLKAAAREGARTDFDESADPNLTNVPDPNTKISERSASGLGGGSLFDMDGLSFGLEVCLDHAEKRLKKSKATEVRVQLIPSCGMTIKDKAKHLDPSNKSFIFNVDGNSVHSVAQKADGTSIAILNTVKGFKSTVGEYGQLFEDAGDIVVHNPEDLT